MAVHKATGNTESETWLQQVLVLGREVRGVMKTQLELAGMEARRAGESFVRMIAFGVFAACLIFMAWALIVSAAVIAVVNAGLVNLPVALVIVAFAHLVAAFYVFSYVKRQGRNLLFSITSKNL